MTTTDADVRFARERDDRPDGRYVLYYSFTEPAAPAPGDEVEDGTRDAGAPADDTPEEAPRV